MNRESLFRMAKEVKCELELGITSEINSFFKYQKNKHEYKLSYKGLMFELVIKVREYNLSKVKELFASLVCFIEYSSTFYVRDDYEDYIEYYLLSAIDSSKGFICHVIFESS